MSNWNVIKTKIEVFDHPDAERLQLGKVGTYQVVVQKGLYEGGEEVVFAPEKSVLTGELEKEYKNYLAGPDQNRVHAVRLRGELSCGIIIPPHLIVAQCGKTIDEIPDDELAKTLGITKYVPEVPVEMNGLAEPITYDNLSVNHDVEQFGVYASNFVDNERVVITCKLHGSQIVAYYAIDQNGSVHKWVSTKNYNAAGLCLTESTTNFYWRAVNDINLWDLISYRVTKDNINLINNCLSKWCYVVQVFGEALPCQSLKYGFSAPTMKIFGVVFNGESIPYDQLTDELQKHWVPILYDGPYENIQELKKLALGNETVSGKELHIKEGIVIRPYKDRRASDGTWLKVKIINKAYKETGEEFS